jgi:hypothetical protein
MNIAFILLCFSWVFVPNRAIQTTPQKQTASVAQMKAEWKKYRKSPDKYSFHTYVTWKGKVWYKTAKTANMLIDDDMKYKCSVQPMTSTNDGQIVNLTFEEANENGASLSRFVKDDWIVVTGMFVGANSDGELVIIPDNIKNLGPED